MKPLFNQVKVTAPKKNAFDLSHEKKLSCNMAELIPIFLQECVPGDRFKVSTEALIRLAPMVAPMMHRVNAYIHYFKVPMRLLYDSWGDYITGGVDGLQNPAFPVLTITDANKAQFAQGLLPDYLGIPSVSGTVAQSVTLNALPFRAYQLIYNEYYRDQNLTTAVPLTKNTTVSAGEQAELVTLRTRFWEKDYFTSALPWTQRGADVTLPQTVNYKVPVATWNSVPAVNDALQVVNAINPSNIKAGAANSMTKFDNITGVDITVNNLRRAIKLQQWLEKNALGGSRYVEQTLVHFGVKSSDGRNQRPEFLGGGKIPISISEVVSTVKETTNPLGTMAGHGIGVGKQSGFNTFCEEHCYILGIMSTLPRTAYQQGIPKMFSKADRYDFYFPEFANLGEQPIKRKELYYDITNAVNEDTFGYAPRFSEYKYAPSTVHGDFRGSLYHWHMGRIFGANPLLNETFVKADPTNRIWAVIDSTDKLWIQLYNNVRAIRPMPVYGTPSL